MSKSEWVSEKISKLEGEDKGRSHEQNVAIALDMARKRGYPVKKKPKKK